MAKSLFASLLRGRAGHPALPDNRGVAQSLSSRFRNAASMPLFIVVSPRAVQSLSVRRSPQTIVQIFWTYS